MNIFGRKSAGRASARPAPNGVQLGRAFSSAYPALGEWPRSYEVQVRDGYLSNVIAQRAVRMVAEGVASVPFSGSDPAAVALVTTTSAGQSLLETVAIHLLLHGNGYVQLLSGDDGVPCELYALRPERISVEADARGWPSGFLYKAGSAATRLSPDQLIHIRTHHPLDDHYGLGCLGAASGPIAIHNAATKWNKALLDNAARPSGALVYEPGEAGTTLSPEQFDRLKAEMEASFSGAPNAGRPMLLEGGLRWQSMSLSPTDMDFIALKSGAARDIALAFGVPPMLLGLPGDATYANYREANKALWRSGVLPLAGKMLAALAQGLRPWFPGLEFAVDYDAIGALAEDRERLWVQLSAADFLTLDEKRELAGFAALGGEDVSESEADSEEPDAVGDAKPDVDSSAEEPPTEVKFNPWHDPNDGQFTFGPGGSSGSGPGDRVGMAKPPKAAPLPPGAFRTTRGEIVVNKPTATYNFRGLNGKGYVPKPEDANLLARIIYAESLSNPEDFEAIGWTTVNRVGERQHGMTLDGVINRRRAYESLEIGGGPKGGTPLWQESANPATLQGDKLKGWNRAKAVADNILADKIADPTRGATFFLSSTTYTRGSKATGSRFFNKRLIEGRFVDSLYISTSKRKKKNHFFLEEPVVLPKKRIKK
jgi:HK97 family phage portal protein